MTCTHLLESCPEFRRIVTHEYRARTLLVKSVRLEVYLVKGPALLADCIKIENCF